MLIFDIGANEGSFTRSMMEKYPDAKYVLVEPNPSVLDTLIKWFGKLSNVQILSNVVSDRSGATLKFYLSYSISTVSTVSRNWIENSRFSGMSWNNSIDVQSITLDDLIQRFGVPDVIKIDVEGHEKEVLLGLSIKCKAISFEWAEEEIENIRLSCEHLKKLGYNEFAFREDDIPYNEVPDMFYSYEQFSKLFFSLLVPENKLKWGMIFVR